MVIRLKRCFANGERRNGERENKEWENKKKTKIKKGKQVTFTTGNGTGKGEQRTGNGKIFVRTNEPSG